MNSSYQAGTTPSLIRKEKTGLEDHIGNNVRFNRHHFLAIREPEDMDQIEAAGVTDDFTMGYADVSGFRLGTCYPDRRINPITRRQSPLRLHPLFILDCTLEEEKYMGLDFNRALTYCRNLVEQVNNVGGELVLLWHNDSVQEGSGSYLRKLYAQLLKELAKQ